MAPLSTIAALATAPAPAGLAVIRVSGSETRRALSAIFKSNISPTKSPRELIYGKIIDYKTRAPIDTALAAFFPGPNSYTGDDVAEFQLHGSLLLVQKVLRSLYSFGVTPAEPGEFTRRAFLNGKCDLVQAEAIADLISATSQEALKVAGDQLKGQLSDLLKDIGEPLRDSLAEIEATIDFPEEEIAPDSLTKITSDLTKCSLQIGGLIESYNYGKTVKEGFRVLLCGCPNVGKSSLLNLFLGTKRAIVTDIPGTTRDLIEEAASIANFRFVFCDSAGIQETSDQVEKIGIELAEERVSWANLVLFVVDASAAVGDGESWKSVLRRIRPRASKLWLIVNKIDITPEVVGVFGSQSGLCDRTFYISAKTKEGFDYIREGLVEEVSNLLPNTAESSLVVTNERQRQCLITASAGLERALKALNEKMPLEFVSAELRLSLTAMEEVVGRTWTEDILGRIFSKFCIGK